MASKPKELSNLQRDLLQLALQGPKAKIWLPKASQQSFPTTYAAIVSLQRRGLLDTEPAKDPDILTWKVTKEGRDALKAPPKADKPEPLPVKPAATPVMAHSAGKAKVALPAAPAAAKAPAKTSAPPPAAKASASAKGGAGGKVQGKSEAKDAAPPAKPARSARPAPATEPARERGGKGQKAVPAAGRSAGKKLPTAARKSGGRGRT
jgi:hypothetical protein